MSCRACGDDLLIPVLDLGRTPIADGLLTAAQLDEPELRVPLDFVFCANCSLAQITETVDPEILFCRDYPYYSSVSGRLLDHFRQSAEQLIADRRLGATSLVFEAASNDGYMLTHFAEAGIPVLGVDPASGPVAAALARGIPTLRAFFGSDLADDLRNRLNVACDVFLANNVLAHVPDLRGFVAGIAKILKPDGIAVIEVPYLLDLVDHTEFDTIYHQHLCYFSVSALDRLFTSCGLHVNDVERTWIHGGSLRLFVETAPRARPRVVELLALERERHIFEASFYSGFAARVDRIKRDLVDLLGELHRSGARIAAYGAAAKATTLCSYVGIDAEVVEYVVDRNVHKAGRYMSGNRLPIVSPDRLEEDPPDFLLVLAWNFADEIIRQHEEFRSRGGRFIIPIPEVKVVT